MTLRKHMSILQEYAIELLIKKGRSQNGCCQRSRDETIVDKTERKLPKDNFLLVYILLESDSNSGGFAEKCRYVIPSMTDAHVMKLIVAQAYIMQNILLLGHD
ncbi:hypothetical protein MUCCIDRAFT_76499 [Mucor lusitanicus CBS 277.49]|uniref:Uncharacterized protein n=1 Tax=Mucor lusitanicus CBS 277.49 TaxID=747725 RepID=A0A168Q2W8_MUCCL|nr:hypothetical protein MUCCIDRAFT_76499 [Mucor lusitanicus CBS 277.49]